MHRYPSPLIALTALVAVAHAGACLAQSADYPLKTVRIIAPFPPGGSVDAVARLLAVRLAESYGQQFVVDNRPGASGTIGMELAANAPADGYTLVVNTIPMVTNPFMFSKVRHDPLRDFAPVSLLTGTASVLVAHPAVTCA